MNRFHKVSNDGLNWCWSYNNSNVIYFFSLASLDFAFCFDKFQIKNSTCDHHPLTYALAYQWSPRLGIFHSFKIHSMCARTRNRDDVIGCSNHALNIDFYAIYDVIARDGWAWAKHTHSLMAGSNLHTCSMRTRNKQQNVYGTFRLSVCVCGSNWTLSSTNDVIAKTVSIWNERSVGCLCWCPGEIVHDTFDVHFNHSKSMVIFSSIAAAIYYCLTCFRARKMKIHD